MKLSLEFMGEMLKLYLKLKKLSGVVREDIVPVMFGYLIHPSAEVKVGELGILLVASYMK